ncbi:Kti12p [Ascoidea rubescens DSM 1968]|uniref:Chromatin associated protein KTI12 n=1 Tax=Ascoidea rubescens DSM 1968 TaxID=1344418 RepID=A0A1D2VCD7_9ASCO|nr:chromatin associated protein KTI12 [Ascoidea rubescens DSM 1968]ODV59143.1 chromatin associated protein KTI12 [Ascoidea rubescens DSM 1968]
MPLVIFTGLPSSGKTTIAQKLISLLNEKISSLPPGAPGANYKVIYHSDKTLGITQEDYRESLTEKASRNLQMSMVKRDISSTNIVILDSPAYIKGFRYQLFCEAKQTQTTHCVIYIMAPIKVCLEYNSKRDDAEKWDKELINQLAMRYEEPDGHNRWDSPLIPIAFDDKDLPIDEIWSSLVLKRKLKANSATIIKTPTSTNYLQVLDKKTQEVISKIIQFQKLQSIGGDVLIEKSSSGYAKDDLYVELPGRTVSVAQLQRIRRTFVSLNRVRSIDFDRIVPLFVEYINKNLSED